MSSSCTLSVIIPTYNRVAHLKEAIGSVCAQRRAPDELIVVNDGSEDGTGAYLEQIQRRTMRIPIVIAHLKHCGRPGAVRNHGIALARGALIAFLDDDDLWHVDKLALQIPLHESSHYLALSHTREQWIKHGHILSQPDYGQARTGYIFAAALRKCCIGPSTVVIRRDLMTSQVYGIGGFNDTLEIAEDYDLWLRVCNRYPVAYLPYPLTTKRAGDWHQLSQKYAYIERFHIEVLDRLLKRNALVPQNREAAMRMLATKARIWARGCHKRGRHEEAQRYEYLAQEYTALLADR